MPLTVNLDPDVAERIEQEARRERVTVQAVVNEALRAHLGLTREARSREPFRVEPHDFGFIVGIDLDKLNR
jgi:predicted transcriptional regulator